jgi:hypothetical protein
MKNHLNRTKISILNFNQKKPANNTIINAGF